MKTTNELNNEFATSVKANIKQLVELFEAYDLAKLGYDMQDQRVKECYNKALTAGDYRAAKDCDRAGIKAGERITDDSCSWLLAENDFKSLQAAALPILVRDGVTDDKGYYLEDWLTIKCDARRALVNFIIDSILPEGMKEQFDAVRLNIVQTGKLLDIIRPLIAA